MAARQYQYQPLAAPPVVAAAPAYDPSGLQWLAGGALAPVALRVAPSRTVLEPLAALFDPARFPWIAAARSPLPAARSSRPGFVLEPLAPAPAFDPRGLQWLPRIGYPLRFLESRQSGGLLLLPIQPRISVAEAVAVLDGGGERWLLTDGSGLALMAGDESGERWRLADQSDSALGAQDQSEGADLA